MLLGEMMELGESSSAAHKEVLDGLEPFDGCFLVGAGFAEWFNSDSHFTAQANEQLIQRISDALKPGDSLLIKGSNRVFWASSFVQQLAQALQMKQA